ncbi:MAG: cytochrome c biogenesis protein ResB [Deltaproteobacteria bacterium]|nr:cytochrome c biogenesis protein ResB [Deltaproteobacteria bacterium]
MERIINIVFDIFSSLKFTIVLLTIILFYLAISTFIPQDNTYLKYISENKPTLFLLFKITGLTDPYHSLFLILWLFLFTFNLIACSLNRLPTIFERVRKNINSSYLPIESMAVYNSTQPLKSEVDIGSILKRNGFKFHKIEKDDHKIFIIKRGLYSPLNFLVVHSSILVIILGITISALYGYDGFIRLTENNKERLFFREVMRGNYIKMPLPFELRLNKFSDISISTGQSVDYISDITIFDNHKELNAKIRVNEPLKYKNILFVQSSYEKNIEHGVFTLRITDREGKDIETKRLGFREEIELLDKRFIITDYFEDVHNMGEAIKIQYGESTIIALKERPSFQNEESDIRVYIEKIEIPYDSILRITYDPGTNIVFIGSSLFLFSLLLIIFYKFKIIAIRSGTSLELLYLGKNIESELQYILSLINTSEEKK